MFAAMENEAKNGDTEELTVCVHYVPPDGKIKKNFLC